MRTPDPVAILGAGMAGLTAASFLRRHGVPFVLYESGDKVAGLASSFRDEEGFTYDFGAHFITNRLASAIGVGADCRVVRRYGESVFVEKGFYGYPFGLLRNFRFLWGGLAGRFRRPPSEESADDWFRRTYGTPFADGVAVPLLEAWSGVPASGLAASVGEKLHHSIGKTMLLKAAARLSHRAVACGYSQEAPENPNIWHVYPEGGVVLLCRRLAEQVEDSIRLGSPVEEIRVESGHVVAVRVRGKEQPVSAVISTAPVHVLAKLVKGTDVLQPLSKFRYRPMVFVNLRFQDRGLLPETVLWTPGKSFPFFRLTETCLSMPWLAPAGKTLITADIGCEVGDKIWTMPEEQLGELCVEHLRTIIPKARLNYLGCKVLRTPIAYPVYLREYENDRRRFELSSGIEGLLSIGRNGEFSHILLEDIYWRTSRKVSRLIRMLQGNAVPLRLAG